MGEAPEGWTAVLCFVKDAHVDPLTKDLVHEILLQGGRAGADVRLDVGIPFWFKAFLHGGSSIGTSGNTLAISTH